MTLKTFGAFLGTAIGLAILIGLLAGGYLLYQYVAGTFAVLEPQVKIVLVTASAVALLCAVIVAEGSKARAQAELSSAAVADRGKLYEALLLLCCEPAWNSAELTKIERSLALHASLKVVVAYTDFKSRSGQQGEPGNAAGAPLDRLLMEMRNDLGRSDSLRSSQEAFGALLGSYGAERPRSA